MPDPALQGLYGLRPPSPGWDDVLAALAIGLILAGLIGVLALAFRKRPRPPTMHQAITRARALPSADRSLVLAGLLRELTDRRVPGPAPWGERAVKLGLDRDSAARLGQLYRPGPAPDPDALERVLLAAGRR